MAFISLLRRSASSLGPLGTSLISSPQTKMVFTVINHSSFTLVPTDDEEINLPESRPRRTLKMQVPPSGLACTLKFDGASKGNPGPAGAGAVLQADDGTLICKLREGLGIATNNVAEYRAVILGLRYALEKGFSRISVQGDSKLVCMQVKGLWQVKNQNLSTLYEELKKLKDRFVSFKISHILRDLNSEADVQANLAITLGDGQVQEESG